MRNYSSKIYVLANEMMRLLVVLSVGGELLLAEPSSKATKKIETSSVVEEQSSSTFSSDFYGEDGNIDLSGFMSEAYGFLPMPMLITEPATGYGGGLTLIYLHDKLAGRKSASGRTLPPSVSGVTMAATANGTYLLGAFHAGYWLEDTLRTVTFLGHPHINIDMYSVNRAIELNMQGNIFYQSAKVRILESGFFLGAAYMYTGAEIKSASPVLDSDFGGSTSLASMTAIAEYDSRDNTMSPDNGMLLNAQARFFNEVFGSDYNFNSLSTQTLFYNTIAKDWHVDLRIQAETVDGKKAPKYLYPFLMMRGVPVMRYQGEHTVLGEVQLGYDFDRNHRWRGLVFGGVGKAFGKQVLAPNASFSEATEHYSGGAGFRYLIAKKFGIRAGIDLATSEDENAIYIQFGTAWKGL